MSFDLGKGKFVTPSISSSTSSVGAATTGPASGSVLGGSGGGKKSENVGSQVSVSLRMGGGMGAACWMLGMLGGVGFVTFGL